MLSVKKMSYGFRLMVWVFPVSHWLDVNYLFALNLNLLLSDFQYESFELLFKFTICFYWTFWVTTDVFCFVTYDLKVTACDLQSFIHVLNFFVSCVVPCGLRIARYTLHVARCFLSFIPCALWVMYFFFSIASWDFHVMASCFYHAVWGMIVLC